MTTNVERYRRIAPIYDLLDLPFERCRYRAIRPLLFRGMAGRLLDAGIETGRNCEFYPPAAIVSGIDTSPAMLAKAHDRCQPWRPPVSSSNSAFYPISCRCWRSVSWDT